MDIKLHFSCDGVEYKYHKDGYDDLEVCMKNAYVAGSTTGRNHAKVAYTASLKCRKFHFDLIKKLTSTDIDAGASKGKSWPGYSWQQSGLYLYLYLWSSGQIPSWVSRPRGWWLGALD